MKLLITFFFILMSSVCFSQATFSFRLGYNNTITTGKSSDGELTGFSGSEAYGSFWISKNIYKVFFVEGGVQFSWFDAVNIIEIPLSIRTPLFDWLDGFSGFQLDYIPDTDESLNPRGYFLNNRLGLTWKIGALYNLSDHLGLEIIYNLGLSKLINDRILDINNARRDTFRVGIRYTL